MIQRRSLWQHNRGWILFAIHRQRILLVANAVVILLAVIFVRTSPALAQNAQQWWSSVNTVLGIGALCGTLLVWQNQARREWRESLPLRLTVVYFYEPENHLETDGNGQRPVMACVDAPLVDSSDIRAMAQQLGSQLLWPNSGHSESTSNNATRRLSLKPKYHVKPSVIDYDEQVVRHSIAMFIDRLPEGWPIPLPENHGLIRDPSVAQWETQLCEDMPEYMKKLMDKKRWNDVDLHD